MLILPFKIGDENYSIGIDRIREIIPVVEFRILPESPDYLKGLINYRGTVCPVIDISMLIKGIPSRLYLSTRIIMIELENSECSFGVLAEKITETIYINSNEIHGLATGLTSVGYIENTIIIGGKIIQLINPEKIFSEKVTIF